MRSLRRRLIEFLLDRGGLLGVLTLMIYVWVAPAHIVDGDNAEFATLGALGGTGHPTGYPLYVLWLRAWSWLPASSPAHASAIATCLLGAALVVILHAACRAWGARPRAADLAVIMFATTPVVFALHTEAEVFAMNGVVVALVLWFSAANGPLRGWRRCIALALVAGLGLSDHVTCALVGGVGVLGFVRGVRETDQKARAIVGGIIALVVGLTPYLYLFVAPDHQGTWGKPSSFADLLHIFMREDYGGPGSFAARTAETYPVDNVLFLARTIGRGFLWVPAVLGLAVIGYRIARPTQETRWGWALLGLSFVIAGPYLATRFNLPVDQGVSSYVIERFHLLPLVLLVVPVACALDLFGGWIVEVIPGELVRSRAVAIVLVICGFVTAAGLTLPHILRTHKPAVEELVINMLRSLPERSVVIGASDDLNSGTAYVQAVLGIRRDVDYVNWPLMGLGWYRERKAKLGITYEKGPEVPSVRVAEHVMRSGRPLFVDMNAANILSALPHYPYGTVYRVLPRGTQPPPLEEIFAINQAVYARFELSYPRPGPDDRWPTTVHAKYAWTWHVLARSLQAAGRLEEAAWARAAEQDIGPEQ